MRSLGALEVRNVPPSQKKWRCCGMSRVSSAVARTAGCRVSRPGPRPVAAGFALALSGITTTYYQPDPEDIKAGGSKWGLIFVGIALATLLVTTFQVGAARGQAGGAGNVAPHAWQRAAGA